MFLNERRLRNWDRKGPFSYPWLQHIHEFSFPGFVSSKKHRHLTYAFYLQFRKNCFIINQCLWVFIKYSKYNYIKLKYRVQPAGQEKWLIFWDCNSASSAQSWASPHRKGIKRLERHQQESTEMFGVWSTGCMRRGWGSGSVQERRPLRRVGSGQIYLLPSSLQRVVKVKIGQSLLIHFGGPPSGLLPHPLLGLQWQ